MACCFGRGRARDADTDHDVYLYPATGDGEVLFQYGGALQPELVYGGGDGAVGTVSAADAMAASVAAATRHRHARVSRRTLDEVAPEVVVGASSAARRRRRRRAVNSQKQTKQTGKPQAVLPEVECAICLEMHVKGNRTRTLPRCAHAFHSACIVQWLDNSELCPVCMQPVVRDSIDSTDALPSI